MSIVKLDKINKVYTSGDLEFKALDNVSFSIEKAELVVVLGSSGAGKTTLLNILGGMDSPTSGEYFVENKNVSLLNRKELTRFRREEIGFVFQFYNLLPNLNAYENVMMSQSNISKEEALEVLESVGLKDRVMSFPSELSGGEQQRVSIARALIKKPRILLCDEPTGALDSKTGVQILSLLYDMVHKNNKTVIIVTHNQNIASIADRVIRISDGKIISDIWNDKPLDVGDVIW